MSVVGACSRSGLSTASSSHNASSSSQSVKLMQQQISHFILSLSESELTCLLENFERSLQLSFYDSHTQRSVKMLQYKCYESKIELHSKIGCGFGRSKEEAISISIKNFFEVILQDESYLYLVQECFRQMRGYTQTQQPPTSAHFQTDNQETEINSKVNLNQYHSNVTVNQSSMTMVENPQNESHMHELQRKIGNISVINGNIAVGNSLNLNNNSHQDISEMLLKFIQEEEKSTQNQASRQPSGRSTNYQPQQYQPSHQSNQTNETFEKGPLTQFQIYQMQLKKQPQNAVQYELPQFPSQAASTEKQKGPRNHETFFSALHPHTAHQSSVPHQQQLQPQFVSNVGDMKMYTSPQLFQPQKQFQQTRYEFTQERDALSSLSSTSNQLQTQQESQQQEVSTPPNNKKRATNSHHQNPSFNYSGKTNIADIPAQLNDTAFLPTQNNIIKRQNSFHVNKENSINNNSSKLFQAAIVQNQSASPLSHQSTTHLSHQQSASHLSHQLSQPGLWMLGSTAGTILPICCSHKEQLDQEQNKSESLEQRLKLLQEENKILKSMLLNQNTNAMQFPQSQVWQETQLNSDQGASSQTRMLNSSKNYGLSTHQPQTNNRCRSLDPRLKVHSDLESTTAVTVKAIEAFTTQDTVPQFPVYKTATSILHSASSQNIPTVQAKKHLSHHTSNSEHKYPQNFTEQSQISTSNARRLSSHLPTGKGDDQMNNSSSNSRNSSVKKPIPKLNLQVLPNYHGNFNKSLNTYLLSSYHSKHVQHQTHQPTPQPQIQYQPHQTQQQLINYVVKNGF